MTFLSASNKICWLLAISMHLVSMGKATEINTIKIRGKDGKQMLQIDMKFSLEIPLKNTSSLDITTPCPDAYKSNATIKEEREKEYTKKDELENTEEGKEEEEEEEEKKEEEVEEDDDEDKDDIIPIEDHPSWRLVESPTIPCGQSVSKRIFGGMNAGLGHHPWIARLGRFRYYKGQYKGVVDWYCAGTVINYYYILTAAHCTNDPDFKTIRLGEYDSNSAKDCDMHKCSEVPQDFTPQHIVNHPNFVMGSVVTPHDIALVRLNSGIHFNGWVVPVCLPRHNTLTFNTGLAEAIGWGKTTSNKNSVSAILQSVKLPIVPGTQCTDGLFAAPNPGTFCAGGLRNQDSCCGDSGGPLLKLIHEDGSLKYYIIGLVSFGPKTCGNGMPAAYTNVSYHLRWILNNIKPYDL